MKAFEAAIANAKMLIVHENFGVFGEFLKSYLTPKIKLNEDGTPYLDIGAEEAIIIRMLQIIAKASNSPIKNIGNYIDISVCAACAIEIITERTKQ